VSAVKSCEYLFPDFRLQDGMDDLLAGQYTVSPIAHKLEIQLGQVTALNLSVEGLLTPSLVMPLGSLGVPVVPPRYGGTKIRVVI
jgi:hypothetical protein